MDVLLIISFPLHPLHQQTLRFIPGDPGSTGWRRAGLRFVSGDAEGDSADFRRFYSDTRGDFIWEKNHTVRFAMRIPKVYAAGWLGAESGRTARAF